MQFFIISHFLFIKVSLDIKMGICFLEKNCHRISEISCLPSLKAKLLFPVCDGIPCRTRPYIGTHGGRKGMRFALLLCSYEVKAQTHTCRTSMGSNIGPCPNC